MKNVKVSLILPSLNVGMYIRECLNSVIGQTLREIEIICVDAGSTDGTLEAIKEYMSRDSRITLINSSKKSYGHQMNLGVEAAEGEYIGIVETDDFVPANMFENLYEIAKNNDVDFVKADFYRFKKAADGGLEKTLFKLSKEKKYYNRIIDIAQEPECFGFVLNTWSGIYKRSFLMENHIRHNESPGASFQDNGFWFQTFMHAHRAYFVDTPYYMNRRDNPNSSVYDNSKIYVICDEYDYILSVLEKYPKLLKLFKGQYTLKLMQNYMWTLERIHYADKPAFFERLQKTFSKLASKKMVDYKVISKASERQAYDFYEITHNPQHWYERVFTLPETIIKGLKFESGIYLYGAGALGKSCYDILAREGLANKVKGFIVTKKNKEDKPYRGVPILTLADVEAEAESKILITVKPLYKSVIREILHKAGFMNVEAWPDSTFIRGTEMQMNDKLWEKGLSKSYVFPFDLVEKGSKVVLYGAGRLGQMYYRQLQQTGYAEVINWVDEDAERFDYLSRYMEVVPELELKEEEFDYVVVAFTDPGAAKAAYWKLASDGVNFDKIVWNYSTMGQTIEELFIQNTASLVLKEQERQLAVLQQMIEQKKEMTDRLLEQAKAGKARMVTSIVMPLTQESTRSDLESALQDCDICMNLELVHKDALALENLPKLLLDLKNDSRVQHIKICTESDVKPSESVIDLLRDTFFEISIRTKYSTKQVEELLRFCRERKVCCSIDYGTVCPEIMAGE